MPQRAPGIRPRVRASGFTCEAHHECWSEHVPGAHAAGISLPPSTQAARFSQQAWEFGSCAPTAQRRCLHLPESGCLIVFAPNADEFVIEAREKILESLHLKVTGCSLSELGRLELGRLLTTHAFGPHPPEAGMPRRVRIERMRRCGQNRGLGWGET